MPRPSTGLLFAGSLATVVTLFIAWPILLDPSQLIYGREIAGRHADPYTLIAQLASAAPPGFGMQPLTLLPGWVLARVMSHVAAFNVLVLLTFPLAAMSAYALARYLTGSHGAGLIAGLAFAFAPGHLAHAAYHPYLAQTQWIPLLVLALAALVDRRSVPLVLGLAGAGAGLILASSDAAFLGMVLSPVILVAFWAIRPDADRNLRPLIWPALAMVGVAAAAVAFLWALGPETFASAARATGPIDDVAFYRARWWAYFIPAVDHPLLGDLARRAFDSGGIGLQLAEQQLFVGFGLLTLALAAVAIAARQWVSDPRWRVIPAVAAVGVVAIIVSLGPTSGSCEPASMAPGCLLFRVAPWFRAYARFGIVAQLMVAVAAGAGAVLLARQSRAGRLAAIVLLGVAVFEYWPMPARAHHVLPTLAHRSLAAAPPGGLTLDCYPASPTEATIPGIMDRAISFLDDGIKTCGDPRLGVTLAGLGYTQVVVRRSPAASALPTPLPLGISLSQSFEDSDLYAVSATPPPLLTVSSDGFFGYEHAGDDWWQWMGPRGQWIVRNTTPAPQRVSLAVDLVSVGMPRQLTLTLDGAHAATLAIGTSRQQHTAGPWTLAPGNHTLAFAVDGEPIRPADVDGSRDTRPLTIAFRNDRWIDTP